MGSIREFFQKLFGKKQPEQLPEPFSMDIPSKERLEKYKNNPQINLYKAIRADIQNHIVEALRFEFRLFGKGKFDERLITNSDKFISKILHMDNDVYNLDDTTSNSLKNDINTDEQIEYVTLPENQVNQILKNNVNYKNFIKKIKNQKIISLQKAFEKAKIFEDGKTVQYQDVESKDGKTRSRRITLSIQKEIPCFTNEFTIVEKTSGDNRYKAIKYKMTEPFDEKHKIVARSENVSFVQTINKHGRNITDEDSCKWISQYLLDVDIRDLRGSDEFRLENYRTVENEDYSIGTSQIHIEAKKAGTEQPIVEITVQDSKNPQKTIISPDIPYITRTDRQKAVEEFLKSRGIEEEDRAM